ncbi:hypothetical protein C8Q80DRAFT_1168049, partial [Daedaleopsis nitida]
MSVSFVPSRRSARVAVRSAKLSSPAARRQDHHPAACRVRDRVWNGMCSNASRGPSWTCRSARPGGSRRAQPRVRTERRAQSMITLRRTSGTARRASARARRRTRTGRCSRCTLSAASEIPYARRRPGRPVGRTTRSVRTPVRPPWRSIGQRPTSNTEVGVENRDEPSQVQGRQHVRPVRGGCTSASHMSLKFGPSSGHWIWVPESCDRIMN